VKRTPSLEASKDDVPLLEIASRKRAGRDADPATDGSAARHAAASAAGQNRRSMVLCWLWGRMGRSEKIGSLEVGGKSGSRSWAEHRWHAEDVNLYPVAQELFEGDLRPLIREWAVPGHCPPAPFLTTEDEVITLGSCFARNLRRMLDKAGLPASRFYIPSGLNNTFALLDLISWCVTGEETVRGFRYDRMEDGAIEDWTPADEREVYRQALADAGAFVFTLGLAEVWEDRETGGVFWRGIPESVFDADRHVSRLSTVAENDENMARVVELIRMVNPAAPIVLTLSPVPLKATFRSMSCITADCASKATLRVAIDQVMNRGLENVYYWPAFEVVRWVGSNLPYSTFGTGGRSRRPEKAVVREIVNAFIEAFWVPDAAITLQTAVLASTDAD
jgi:hypothetical protein